MDDDIDDVNVVSEERCGLPSTTSLTSLGDVDLPALELSVTLARGVGVSLVNYVPEELIYVELNGIQLRFTSERGEQVVDASIHEIKVSQGHNSA